MSTVGGWVMAGRAGGRLVGRGGPGNPSIWVPCCDTLPSPHNRDVAFHPENPGIWVPSPTFSYSPVTSPILENPGIQALCSPPHRKPRHSGSQLTYSYAH